MIEVYYYVPAEELDDVVDCGLKLSKWYDKEITIDGSTRKCITAFLNPKDDIEKYNSKDLRCVKLEIAPNYCYVSDGCLYITAGYSREAMELYLDSIVPIEKYIFGSYRLPECLVTSTVIGGSIAVLDKRRDSPVLFNNSEELYVNNILEFYKERHPSYFDAMMYYFYKELVKKGRMDIIESQGSAIAVFKDKEDGKVYTVRIPNMDK